MKSPKRSPWRSKRRSPSCLDIFSTKEWFFESTRRGELVALAHILQSMDHWRRKGKEIQTEGLFQIASAAALLLALGEVGDRTVHRHSSVFFHHTRIAGSASAITAGSATRIAAALRRSDLGLLKRVVNHVEDGLGGISQLCSEGLARCEMLRQNAAEISMALNIAPSGRSPRWLSAVAAAYRECDQKITTLPYQRYLEKRFEQETEMEIPEAYALNLIDCVYGLPRFSPVSKANNERLAAPSMRLVA